MKRLSIFLSLLCCALLVLLAAGLFGQQQRELAVFAFTGGSVTDGEAIASSLTRQSVFRSAFNKTTLITRATIAAKGFEQRFQRNSGLTDADTIFELGRELNASHVVAGYIAKLGDRNLVLVSVMDVESLQQVAGAYQTYGSIEEMTGYIPDMAKKLAAAMARNTSKLPGLSVPPFSILSGVNRNDAMVLAQMLACDLANGNKYAVLPRTDSIDKVLEEHKRQRSGATETERAKRLGAGRNAKFVLSGSVERLGNSNKFGTDVLNIEDGSFADGYESEPYANLAQGFESIPKLAALLNGGTSVVSGSFSANLVFVEGGTFQMGSKDGESDEKPVHSVTVKSFSIAQYEVTQKEWVEIMGSNPSKFKGDTLPVENVSWFNAVEYCNRRSQKEGLKHVYSGSGDSTLCDWDANGYRLPTEAEWEYAARGGNKDSLSYDFSGSNDVNSVAWYWSNSKANTKPVGTKQPNSLGLYDMSGNVYEWCWDRYSDNYYKKSPSDNPRGPVKGSERVRRGGGHNSFTQDQRVTYRDDVSPSSRSSNLGFRVVRNMQ